MGKTRDIANKKMNVGIISFFSFKRVATGQQLLGAKPALIWHLQLHSIAPDSACLWHFEMFFWKDCNFVSKIIFAKNWLKWTALQSRQLLSASTPSYLPSATKMSAHCFETEWLTKLGLTLLIIIAAHVHVVFRLTRIMWLTFFRHRYLWLCWRTDVYICLFSLRSDLFQSISYSSTLGS